MAAKGKGKQLASKAPAGSSSGKRKPSSAAPSYGGESSRSRKRRRPGVLQFVDDAASVDDGESDGDDDDGDEDLVDDGFLENAELGNRDTKGSGKTHQLPFLVKVEELSGDELEELIKERYGRGSEYIEYDEDSKECESRLPEAHDMKEPTIWRVKCMIGRERQIALSFMQKFVDVQDFGTRLQIISVFALDHVKGYIYVEADKACDVAEACQGFCNVYQSRIVLVPRNEVPQLLTTRNKTCAVSKGAWVRMKNGRYKGDLAQVVAVDEGRNSATVKLVPRIDLEALAKKFGGGVSLKLAAVPAPRLISSHELEVFRPHIQVRHDRKTGEVFDVLDGLMLKDGCLFKKVSIGSLICWGVEPSNAELLKFTNEVNDGVEDLNWITSVYSGGKKSRVVEGSDQSEAPNHGNGYDLFDLVLFGRKAFGVVIAVENDSFQILKGDMEEPEVVTVKKQEIKKGCVDKMFTASGHHMVTIYIDDVIKVLEGPLEGREGIVRHMYRGTLFIYDDSQVENSGFFCVKSGVCEKIKESKNSRGGKACNKSSPLFPQSPPRSDQQEDSNRIFDRYQKRNADQAFSIGQTLRIRKGPLKGYLCRVVGIYRTDVTVKLDSLVKVITVEENCLCEPNLKRDVPSGMSCDPLGAGDRQSMGGLFEEEVGASVDKSSWDAEVPPAGRTSWQSFSTCSLPLARNKDEEIGQEQEADPWGSKVSVSYVGACNSDKAMDSWDKPNGSRGEQNSAWSKIAGEKAVADGEADCWNKVSLTSGSGAADGWKTSSFPRIIGGGTGQCSEIENQVSPSDDKKDGWDRARSRDQCHLPEDTSADGQNAYKEKNSSLERGSAWARPDVNRSDKVDAWDIKGKSISRNDDDTWGKAVKSQLKTNNDSDGWGKSCDQSAYNKADSTTAVGGNQAETWGSVVPRKAQSAAGDRGQSTSWDQVKIPVGSQSENQDKARDMPQTEHRDWNKDVKSCRDQADGWNRSKAADVDQLSSWDKAKCASGGQSSWNKSNNDEDKKDARGNWDKPKSLEGANSGWGRGRGQNAGNSNGGQEGTWKMKDRDERRGSGWGRGMERNEEADANTEEINNWSQQKSFGGFKESSWGRGSALCGARGGGGQNDNWNRAGDSDSGWGSGRGRGRGGRGERGGYRENLDGGRSRDWGRGSFQCRDGRNGQDNSEDGTFSKKPFSSWGDDQIDGSNKPKPFGRDAAVASRDQSRGWNTGNSSHGGSSSGWIGDSQGAVDKEASRTTEKSAGMKEWSEWKKDDQQDQGGRAQPDSAGDGGGNGEEKWSRPRTYSGRGNASNWKNDEDGWNRPKTFGGYQSSPCDGLSPGYRGKSAAGDRHEGWNPGMGFNGDQSSAWRGNSSNRGRGRGRSFGRGQSSQWNDGAGDGSSATFDRPRSFGRGQPSAWNQEGCESGGGGFQGRHESSGRGVVDKASWGGWKSGAGEQPGGWSKPDGGWGKGSSAAGEGGILGPVPAKTSNQQTGSGGSDGWNASRGNTKGWASGKQMDVGGSDAEGTSHKGLLGKQPEMGEQGNGWSKQNAGWQKGSSAASEGWSKGPGFADRINQNKGSNDAGGSSEGWHNSGGHAKKGWAGREPQDVGGWNAEGTPHKTSWAKKPGAGEEGSSWAKQDPEGRKGSSVGSEGGWNQKSGPSDNQAQAKDSGASAGWEKSGGSAKQDGWSRGGSRVGEEPSTWNRGQASEDEGRATGGGDPGGSSEKAAGGWGKAKEGGGKGWS